MSKFASSASIAVSPASTTTTPAYEMNESLALMYEAMVGSEEAPPASEERPSLHLVTPPPAVIEVEPETAPDVAPLAHTCPECNAQVANLPSVWSLKHEKCNRCAYDLICKDEKAERIAARTCACGNWKHEDLPLCRDCYEKAKADREEARKAAEANRLICPKCGEKKDEAYHKVCRSCFTASRPTPAPRPQVRKSTRPGTPEYTVSPAVRAKTAARAKLAQELLASLRAGTLEKSFPGAKVTSDTDLSSMLCIAYQGDSYTIKDPCKVSAIAEAKVEAARKAAIDAAEKAHKAAAERKAAAEKAKLNKSNEPKKGKKDKSDSKSGKSGKSGKSDGSPATKAERKASRDR